MTRIYLDYAAATPMSQSVLSAMQPFFTEKFYNPSALYLASKDIKSVLNEARSEVAKVLGCRSSEIIFTAGGTESDNLAISGVMQSFPGKNCIVSAIEHEAVLKPASQYPHKVASVMSDGRIDLDKLAALIDDDTVLVSVMYANNEIGTIQPLKEIASLIKKVRQDRLNRSEKSQALPLYFHTDACQAANYLSLSASSLGVDLMTLNGGKIYGPKQSGVLFVKTGTELKPLILGGGQERNIRSGTENVPAIVGFSTALREAAEMSESQQKTIGEVKSYMINELSKKLPQVRINGSLKHRLPNNVHITIPDTDNERIMMELDELGIMVATGSACSASSDEPSHVLSAIGLTEEEARSSLRISFGRKTDKAQIDLLISSLVSLVAHS